MPGTKSLLAFLVIVIICVALLNQFEATAASSITRTIHFTTDYGTTPYSEQVTIPSETLAHWQSTFHPPALAMYPNGSYTMNYSHYLDIVSVGNISKSVASVAMLGEEDVADTVLSFVHNVGYNSTSYSLSNTLYPVETLAEGGV